MHLRLIICSEHTGRFDDDIDLELLPRKLQWVALARRADLLSINDQLSVYSLYCIDASPIRGIVLEEVCKVAYIAKIIHGNYLKKRILECHPEECPSNAS